MSTEGVRFLLFTFETVPLTSEKSQKAPFPRTIVSSDRVATFQVSTTTTKYQNKMENSGRKMEIRKYRLHRKN